MTAHARRSTRIRNGRVPTDPAAVMASFPTAPGLYLHVPFCSQICPFCPYNKVPYRAEPVTRYFEGLNEEVRRYATEADGDFTSLYVGGGTPTLCLDELAPLLEGVPVAGERAIEVLPNHATPEVVSSLRGMGFNYLSLGIQSFDAGMLEHLKRPNTVEDNLMALDNTIGHFDCIDVDLIFDAAYQDQATFLRDMEICFGAGVQQVSTYPLMRFGYTPFGKARHAANREHEALRRATELAERYGYERRSVWTFNRRDSATYTSITREFYLGVGAGAGTFTGPWFLLNHFAIEPYVEAISAGRLPVARAIHLSSLRSAAYYLFWQAYTGRIDIDRFRALYPKARSLHLLPALLRSLGLLSGEGSVVRLTPSGYDRYHDLERWVTYHFIEPLWEDMMREHAWPHLPTEAASKRFWLKLMGARPVRW